MATRALIAYLDDSKKLTSTYNHYDGYPDYLGKILLNHFDDDTAAKGVAMEGYISNIDEDGTINSKYDEAADTEILDEESFSAAMQIGGKVNEYGGDYGYIWFNKQWNTIKNNGIEGMAKQIVEELEESGMYMVDENINEKEINIMEQGYEAKWANFLNEAKEMDFSVIKRFIQDDLQRGDEKDPALDAYIESLQRDFAAGRDSDYSDYEMDDYVEDFQNYEADKMDS